MEDNKYAICEIPLFIDSKDEKKFSLEAQAKIFVISQWRFSQAFQTMRQVLEKGTVGNVLFCNAILNVNRNGEYYSSSDWRGLKKREGGMLYNQGIHLLDTLLKVLNIDPNEVNFKYFSKQKLKNTNIEIEDHCNLLFAYKGMSLNIEIATCFPENTQDTSIKIIGTEDAAIMSGKTVNNLEFLKKTSQNILNIDENLHLKNIEAIIDYIFMNQDSNLICNFNEALGRIKFIEKAYSFQQK